MTLLPATSPTHSASEAIQPPASGSLAWVPETACWLLIVGVFVERSLVGWRRWGDVLHDFGRELYVPWRLADGAVLYRDVSHIYGPLSPYLNSLWFRLFGVSLATLIVVNMVLLVIQLALVWYLVRRACGRLAALTASLTFLVVFAFGAFVQIGNYNYICPYCHELTHGSLLTLLLLTAWTHYRQTGRMLAAFVTGMCLGLLFLGKPETFLAGLVALVAGLVIPWGDCRGTTRRSLALLVVGLLLPLILCFLAFRMALPTPQSSQAVVAGWLPLLFSSAATNPYYLWAMGMDTPLANFGSLLRETLVIGMFLVAGYFLSQALGSTERPRRLFVLFATALFLGGLLVKAQLLPLLLSGLALPASALGIGVAATALCWRRPDLAPRLAPVVMWAAWALVLLGKMILRPRIEHYGFALACPAGVLLAAVLVGLVPDALERLGGAPGLLRGLLFTLLLTDLLLLGAFASSRYREKTAPFGHGSDLIYTYNEEVNTVGTGMIQLLAALEKSPSPGELVVIPEGIMLNYQLRRPSSVPYVSYFPVELMVYGESAILEGLEQNPPSQIAILKLIDVSGYGVEPFGAEPSYGARIKEWIMKRYVRSQTISVRSNNFFFGSFDEPALTEFAVIWRRKP